MLTETSLPLASVTVVVTEPSAPVVTLLVVLEDALLPPPDEAAGLGVALPETDNREVAGLEAGLMLPLMIGLRLMDAPAIVPAEP